MAQSHLSGPLKIGGDASVAVTTGVGIESASECRIVTGDFRAAAGTLRIEDSGTVTQGTSKSTGVTLSKRCGVITMHNAALNAGVEVVFTVTNTTVDANDVIIVNIASVGTSGSYLVAVSAVGAGVFDIVLSNASAGNLSEAVVLNFAVIKCDN